MTNRERYQRAFVSLHASNMRMEVRTMRARKKTHISKFAVVCAAVIVLVVFASVAYATNLGGVRQTVSFWFHGSETSALMEQNGQAYTISWEDENGETRTIHGGAASLTADGTWRSMTPEEIAELHQTDTAVERTGDGRIILYFHDQVLDITNRFEENGTCRIELSFDGEAYYWTIRDDGDGFSMKGAQTGYLPLD